MFENNSTLLICILGLIAIVSIVSVVVQAKKNDGKITTDEMLRLFMVVRSVGFGILDEVMTMKSLEGNKEASDKYVMERLTQVINENESLLASEKQILLDHLPDLVDMLVKDAEQEENRNKAKAKALKSTESK